VYTCPGRNDLECYGSGFTSWGIQTNLKAFAAFAVLAEAPDLDASRTGVSRDELRRHALAMLRFALETHSQGSFHCTDGTKWGVGSPGSFTAVLGLERAMHGVEAIRGHLTCEDKELMRRVLCAEADGLVDDHEIVAGRIQSNCPESNMWNGAFLHRVAILYPEASRASEYREKGTRFLANSISVAADAVSAEILDGKLLSEWHVGDNFFESFACNHHGYLNVGYMVICLSNAAMLYLACREKDVEPPPALFHHLRELWDLVKLCTAPDGRLIRIGGDTRVPYCYCQDYTIPTWLMAADLFGDADCPGFEKEWLAQVGKEVVLNGDGSYLAARCRELRDRSPVYYTRLESDRAVTLSMGAYWRRRLALPAAIGPERRRMEVCGRWRDPYHGAFLDRGRRRMASWVWRAAEPPQGLCLPPARSDLAAWPRNCAGEVLGVGARNSCVARKDNPSRFSPDFGGESFEGGFLTCGRITTFSQGMMEGMPDHALAVTHIAFAALPDDRTVMAMQYAVAPDARVYILAVKGLLLRIPNDVFNGNCRTYYGDKQTWELEGVGSKRGVLDTGSNWLNVDDSLSVIGVYGAEALCLYRPGKRQLAIRDTDVGTLYADEVCYPCDLGLRSVDADAALFDIAFVLQSDVSHQQTAEYAGGAGCMKLDVAGSAGLRAMAAKDLAGRLHVMVANFGEEAVAARVELPGPGGTLATVAGAEGALSGKTLSCEADGFGAGLYCVGRE